LNQLESTHQNISCGSYHRLVTATLIGAPLNTQTIWGIPTTPYLDWSSGNIKTYNTALSSFLSNIPTSTPTTKQGIKTLNQAITKAILESLKPLQIKRKLAPPPSSEDHQPFKQHQEASKKLKILHLKLLLQKKAERLITWKQINSLQQIIRQSILANQKNKEKIYWAKLASTISKEDTISFWKLIKKITKTTNSPFPDFITHKDTTLTNPTEILNHITNYYQSLSNNADPEALSFFKKASISHAELNSHTTTHDSTLQALREIPTKHTGPNTTSQNSLITSKEIDQAIQNFKPHKSSGPDCIPAESFKHAPDVLLLHLRNLYQACFTLHYTPPEWQKANTVLLHKGGANNIIKNYRPITLLNTIFKLWERILEQRLRNTLETNNILSPLQQGSRSQRSTPDTILSSRLLQEYNLKNKITDTIYTAQIDLSKAYNRVPRAYLWGLLAKAGIQGNLWRSIQSTYSNYADCISIGTKTSPPSKLTNGVRQGSVLSPLLFIISINPLIEELLKSNTGLSMPNFKPHNKIPCFMFVDDLILLAPSLEDIDTMINIIIKQSPVMGYVINLDKNIKLYSTSTNKNSQHFCDTHPLPLKKDTTYVYLGASLKPTSKTNSSHIRHCKSRSHKILNFMHNRGLKNGAIDKESCTIIINNVLTPKLTYAMNALNLSQKEYTSIDTFISDTLVSTHDAPNPITYGSHPLWTSWEESITPPSIIIQRAKLKLYHRITLMTSNNILKHIFSNVGQSSFHQDLELIQTQWGSPKLISTLTNTPSKHSVKAFLNQEMENATNLSLYHILPQKWKSSPTTSDTTPEPIPLTLPLTTSLILKKARASALFQQHSTTCHLCNHPTPDTVLHRMLQCTSPIRQTHRDIFWNKLTQHARDSLQLMTPTNQILLILGLIHFSDLASQIVIMKQATKLYNKVS
jgi:hypothetical protein